MSVGPPPLPDSAASSESSSFARVAANVCLAAPLLIFGLSFCVSLLRMNHQDAGGRAILAIFGFVALGFSAIGVFSGLLAIALSRPGQRAPILIRTGGGLLLLGALAAIAVPNFVRARTLALQNKAALQDVHTASTELRQQAIASLNSSQPQPVDAQPLEQSLTRAAAKTSGDTAAMLKGSAAFLQRMQTCKSAYEEALRELLAAKVLATRNLVQQDQIQQRKAVVTKFLNANDAVKAYVVQGEANYRKELAPFQMSAAQREAAMNGFRKSFGLQVPVLVEIRDADDRMGKAMLGVLDLLDDNWAHWRYEETTGLVRFEDRAAVAQYNDFMAQLRQAATDQAAAQKRLASVMNRSTSTW